MLLLVIFIALIYVYSLIGARIERTVVTAPIIFTASHTAIEFTEHWGQLFNLSVFFLFGLLVARDWRMFNWRPAFMPC